MVLGVIEALYCSTNDVACSCVLYVWRVSVISKCVYMLLYVSMFGERVSEWHTNR